MYRSIFLCWLEDLLKDLQKKDIQTKNYLLILDHASIHKGQTIDDLAAKYKTRIVYLPTYIVPILILSQAQALLEVQRKTQ
ncbi:transposase [uncultured Acinetobacter sp.]|uniref:transposase n=1 Tax=Acinetobacter sp. TaxID=472 RepID=UPI00345D66ED